MAESLSTNSTVGALLDDERSRAVLDQIIPELASNPSITMARGMSLRMVAGFSGGALTPDLLDQIDAALSE